MVSKQPYSCISNSYWRSESLWSVDNWAHMLPQASRQVHSACSVCVFAHLLPLLPRPHEPHVCLTSPCQRFQLSRTVRMHTWSFRLSRSFRLLHVCHKAFLPLNMPPNLCLFCAVSEKTRIWCPPWTAGIWFWSRPGGRAGTTPPSATSTTTMSLSGWRT